MATITWTGAAGDGNFENPANWNPQQVPGSTDTAVINPAAAVTINVSDTVASLTTAADVTLTVGDYQTLQVGSGGTLATFSNGGTLLLNNGHDVGLVLDAKTTSLTGGGTIEITNRAIQASAAGQVLANLNNTIAGSGSIGAGTLSLNNGAAGVIDANQSGNTLEINTGAATANNAGLLEATLGGNLQIDTSVNNSGKGSIAANGGSVTFIGGTIAGGTLAASNGGTFYDSGTVTLNGGAAELFLNGNLLVTDYSELNLLGTIANAGTLSEAYVHGAGILIGGATGGTVTLTGGGTVTLASGLQAAGTNDVLDNVNNTIGGNASLGDGTALSLINEAAGVIAANDASLTVNTASRTVMNHGLLEATNGGALYLDSGVSNLGTGNIQAAGGNVYLQDGSSVLGGTLSSGGGSVVEITSGATLSVLNGVTNTGTVQIADGSSTVLLGTITNTGTIFENYVHGTGLLIGPASGAVGKVTLTGGGTITLASNLVASQSGDTLDNVNNTINGYNQLGGGTNLALINEAAGVVDANDGNITLNTGKVTVINHGLLEASVGSSLFISAAVSNGATGQVTAAGGDVYLQDGSAILGGTLASSGGAAIVVSSGATPSVLDGRSNGITNTGTLQILDGGNAELLGTITNTGLITQTYVHGNGLLIGPASGAVGTVTLSGGGTVTLASSLLASQSGDTLVNAGNTINGYGSLGNGSNLAILNQAGGVIDAQTGAAIAINTGSAVLMNAGLIEAGATGVAGEVSGLQIDTVIDNGAGGIVGALGGNVTLNDGSVIRGGTLSQSGTTHFYVSSGGTLAVLDGTAHAITIAATVEVQDYSGLVLEGSIINDGTIFRDYVHGPGIEIAAGTVFTNNGTLMASQGSLTFGTNTVLTNDYSPASNGTLTVGTLTGGTYEAFGSTLSFASAVVGTLGAGTNLDLSGGTIAFEGRDVLTSLTSILAGGVVSVSNESDTGSQTLTNAGMLVLDAATYRLTALVNSAGGTLGGNGNLAATVKNTGIIDATGGELDLTGKINSIGGTVTGGAGDFVGFGGTAALLSTAVVTASDLAVLNNSSLQLGARLSFAGTFDIRGNATLSGAGLTSSGLFEQVGNGTGTITTHVTSTGTISTNQGGTLAFSGGLTNSGLILDNGGFTDTAALPAGSLTVGAAGTASIASAAGAGNSALATLTVQGGSLNTNGTTLTVVRDYNNTAAGTANSYTPFAGVTGTIDAQGTQLSVVGVNGTTITSAGGTETISIAAGQTAYFEIENSGAASSTLLRGALETSANGGSITGTALTGSGVTAGNFGPLAGGAASSVYAISYDGSAPLSGEQVYLASDFANVAGITIDIVAAGSGNTAPAETHASLPVWHVAAGDWYLSAAHHG